MFKNIFKTTVINILLVLIFLSNEHNTQGQRTIVSRRRVQQPQQHSRSQPILLKSANGCLTSSQIPGTCVPLSTCSEALYDLRYYHKQPTICSANSRLNPIVCCATSVASRSSSAPRPASIQSRISQQTQQTNGQKTSEKKCYENYLANFGRTTTPAIVGGTKTYPGEFPYMAALGWSKGGGSYDYKCGGVLIDKRFVLTAAHCLSVSGTAPNVVNTGGYPLNSPQGIIVQVSEVFTHPEYNSRYNYNDIGLVKLVDYAPQTPACLWQSSNANSASAIAVGYGQTSFAGRFSNDLLKIVIKTYSNQECTSYFPANNLIPYGLASSHLCAGNAGRDKDTCQGDSGGPLILVKNVQNVQIPFVIGVTSFGQNCAGSAPGVYTRISSYLSWIESIVWRRRRTPPRRVNSRYRG